jgi:rhodanese-related sulfurtransferase
MKNFILFLLLMSGIACTQNAAGQAKIKPDVFEQTLKTDKSAQLIDVRTPEEFTSGHLENARNFDYYAPDFAKKLATLDKNKPVLVYCAVGGRSGSAAAQLKQMGFKNILDLEGGFRAWSAAGKKVVK